MESRKGSIGAHARRASAHSPPTSSAYMRVGLVSVRGWLLEGGVVLVALGAGGCAARYGKTCGLLVGADSTSMVQAGRLLYVLWVA